MLVMYRSAHQAPAKCKSPLAKLSASIFADRIVVAVQLNSSYYSAVGSRDPWYLLARAIQFFTPGIPLVYYVGLLAGENDIDLVESTQNGRDLNRHKFESVEEAAQETERPVVQVSCRSVSSFVSLVVCCVLPMIMVLTYAFCRLAAFA